MTAAEAVAFIKSGQAQVYDLLIIDCGKDPSAHLGELGVAFFAREFGDVVGVEAVPAGEILAVEERAETGGWFGFGGCWLFDRCSGWYSGGCGCRDSNRAGFAGNQVAHQ